MPEKFPGAKAVLYARVSTDDKDQRPETQVVAMEEYCREREIEIVSVYKEKQSAGDLDRHEWDSMMGRIMRGGITFLIARDESRISRDVGDMAEVVKLLSNFGTVIRYVNSSSRPEDDAGKLLNSVNTWQAEVERKKLKANTSSGMQQRIREKYHMGRFLVFAFSEDIAYMDKERKGRINTDPARSKNGTTTKIYPEDYIYAFAREGKSLTYVAEKVIGIPHSVLIAEMKPREKESRVRYNKDGEPVRYYRYKGLKDRYSVYMAFYDEAISRRKGVSSEKVIFGGENPSEKEGK